MADLLSIGLSGLAANKTSLAVTGHNITNVNTPGYTRQDTVQATRIPQFSGAGYIGSGTTLVEIRRSYSEFLTTQVRTSTALSSDVEAYRSQIEQLDSLLAGTTTGITPSLQKFFSSLQTAAEDPANIPARQLVLSEAEGLARRFNTVYDRISEQNEFINKQMVAVSDQVNRLATSVAGYNEAIAVAAANGQQPNDLLDAREEAIRQLSTYVGVTVVAQDDSSVNLFVGSGQPLVVGSTTSRLEVVPGRGDPTRFEVNFVSGGSSQGITSLLTGGELGGLIRYRAETLDPTLNSLGRLALAVSDQVNTQLGQGLDLKGQVGTALFGDFNDAALAALRVRAYSTNTGNVQPALNIIDSSILTTSDYRLEYDGTNYTARRLSDGEPMTLAPAGPYTYPQTLTFTDAAGRDQGFELVIDSAPAAGDQFLLQPTRRGATSITTVLDQPDQLAFTAPVRAEAQLQNSGSGTISQPDLIAAGASPIDATAISVALPVALTYNGAGVFENPPGTPVAGLTRVPAGAFVPGQLNTYELDLGSGNRVSFTISGRPEGGDSFNLSFNTNGVSDNRNALKLVDLQSKQTVGVDPTVSGIATGVSFTDGYGDLVERVGTLTAQARQDSEATGAILKQATDNRDSLSAVNLDEEAANLIKFEQYYNASAQIIQVARSLFDTLINTF
ncbi:flagellar hook-associated protein FlgK [Aquipseudomonas alcaligenes]|uniref:Flagellar hook-associated protein 1 n=1 Tax=Aquipseudomonas alcaligenes TaxID=43263 RepID=A0AA37FL10_AQUAC|nr:flagellar hook-associated protein FlgK [Pseudomonas alcaligenes]BCR24855.1 flagellar hook-associated protein FlgK [Pseudomonas alcaligenes]GIZ66031.1 flagellar hook-associated protein FlgK [Pseudomonas alcaligenes]GIZ70376.1 flagellar hook-associated protein FlgK [Pseudomonas alcaligenes]GIZ74729.1 flagellar hook-associated protein FlgK [Pseudomonas alcaligenes]GIZ79045.1 flagellar hook-associated protein FlgK [Pseudomonas alcaligenes]